MKLGKKMKFFIYLIESYAVFKNIPSYKLLEILDDKKLTDFIYDMYFMYHQEAIEKAFTDIDSLIETGKPAF